MRFYLYAGNACFFGRSIFPSSIKETHFQLGTLPIIVTHCLCQLLLPDPRPAESQAGRNVAWDPQAGRISWQVAFILSFSPFLDHEVILRTKAMYSNGAKKKCTLSRWMCCTDRSSSLECTSLDLPYVRNVSLYSLRYYCFSSYRQLNLDDQFTKHSVNKPAKAFKYRLSYYRTCIKTGNVGNANCSYRSKACVLDDVTYSLVLPGFLDILYFRWIPNAPPVLWVQEKQAKNPYYPTSRAKIQAGAEILHGLLPVALPLGADLKYQHDKND